MKKCPWCGQEPAYSQNTPKKLGCKTEDCPLRGILMTLKMWNNRGNLQKVRRNNGRFSVGHSI
jgi:hypothetical protein